MRIVVELGSRRVLVYLRMELSIFNLINMVSDEMISQAETFILEDLLTIMYCTANNMDFELSTMLPFGLDIARSLERKEVRGKISIIYDLGEQDFEDNILSYLYNGTTEKPTRHRRLHLIRTAAAVIYRLQKYWIHYCCHD